MKVITKMSLSFLREVPIRQDLDPGLPQCRDNLPSARVGLLCKHRFKDPMNL